MNEQYTLENLITILYNHIIDHIIIIYYTYWLLPMLYK